MYNDWPDAYRQCSECNATKYMDDMVCFDPAYERMCIECAGKHIADLKEAVATACGELAFRRKCGMAPVGQFEAVNNNAILVDCMRQMFNYTPPAPHGGGTSQEASGGQSSP